MTHAEKIAWEKWLKLIAKIDDPTLLDECFKLFLTPEEHHLMAKRYAIIEGLMAGEMPQRELAKSIEVSIAKITRGSNSLKTISPTLKTRLKNHLKETK